MDINDIKLAASARIEEILALEKTLFKELSVLREERLSLCSLLRERVTKLPTISEVILTALSTAPEVGFAFASLAEIVVPQINSTNPRRCAAQTAWTMKHRGQIGKTGRYYHLLAK